MDFLKRIYLIPVLLLAGLLISACTHDETNESVDNSSRVRVINDDTDDVTSDDQTTDDDTDVDVTEEDPAEEPEEEEEEVDGDPVISEDGLQELDGATSADGAYVSTFSYGIEGGKLEFGWGIDGSSGLSYAKATAGFDTEGNLVVTFPDIKRDYLHEDVGDTLELSGDLPDVEIETINGGTRYTFMFGAERDFTLTGDADEGMTVISVTL